MPTPSDDKQRAETHSAATTPLDAAEINGGPDGNGHRETLIDGPTETESGEVARVPFTITCDQGQQLADLGYSRLQVDAVKPEEAQAILASGMTAEEKLPAELRWRVDGMRNLLPETGKPIPVLVASESAEPKRGECFSCAQPLPSAQPGYLQALCDLCRAAQQIVLGLEPASTFIN